MPSITELIWDLGLSNCLVGRTKFCIHPKEEIRKIPKVGGTKNVDVNRVIATQPAIIIANKEENEQRQIEALSQDYPIWISDIATFNEAMEMVESLGFIFDKELKAKQIIADSKAKLQKLKPRKTKKVAYLIWQKPYMTVGRDTYIHDMLRQVGFKNVFEDKMRYPTFTIEELKERQPEIILLSSEPFPFKEKHIHFLRKDFPNIPIQLVDGEAFSWYGTRFLKTFDYLSNLSKSY